MRGTDPIKSRWECLRIVMFVAKIVFEFLNYESQSRSDPDPHPYPFGIWDTVYGIRYTGGKLTS